MNRARTILWGKLAWHPAVKAWLTFARDGAEPETIEVLRSGSTAAWRLEGVGPEGAAIIARRLPAARAAAARAVYERLLARLPIQRRRYYGWGADGAGFVWLFFAEASDGV